MMYRPALTAALIFALIGVAIGAMGAHALRPYLTPDLQLSFETAVKYQFYHSFALAFAGFLYLVYPGAWVRRATLAFVLGIILFSGSIYLLVYLKSTASVGLGGLGILTPIGGICLMLGWIFLLLGIHSRKKKA
jgi:uncharacterized membrane protein YgdD (TMEM256/DUF423 family)